MSIFDSVEIESDVFIGPNVTFTNDVYPKSRRIINNTLDYPKTRILKGASIGAGATILPGIIIGENSIIGAGAIITKNVDAETVVYNEGAKFRRKI